MHRGQAAAALLYIFPAISRSHRRRQCPTLAITSLCASREKPS